MFCMECGKQIPESAKFCMLCGAKITESYNVNANTSEMKKEYAQINNDAEGKKLERTFIVAKDTAIIGSMLNGKKLQQYSTKYMKNHVYKFPIGKAVVEYPEHIVMLINTAYFFRRLKQRMIIEFRNKYLERVVDMESFYSEGLPLYHTTHLAVSEATVQLLVASGVMTISAENINQMLPQMHERLNNNLNQLFALADKIVSQVKTDIDIREMNSMLDANNGYSAAGFGFSGVMGGIAAAGLMNAGSSAIRKIRDGIANSRDRQRLQDALDELFVQDVILDELILDLNETIYDAYDVYCAKVEEERKISFAYSCEQNLSALAENTMKYMSNDTDSMVANLCKVLSGNYQYSDVLEYLFKYFYDDKEILKQLKELAGFLLFNEESQIWLEDIEKEQKEKYKHEKAEKREKLKYIFEMPEKTSEDISKKMARLKEESEKISYDASEEINKLENLRIKAVETEKKEPLKRALALPENTIKEIDYKLSQIKEAADKIDYNVADNIKALEQKKQEKIRENKEREYHKALNLPEGSIEEINKKILRVREEAEKIGYDCNNTVFNLEKKKEDIVNKQNGEKRDEIIEHIWEIIVESWLEKFKKEQIIEYLHGTLANYYDEKKFEDDLKWQETLMRVYNKEINLYETEIPLLFYDDTLSKNGNDSFMITSERVISSYMGKVEQTPLDKVSSYVQVAKLFSASVLINNQQKLSIVMAGKKNVPAMAECIRYTVEAAKIVHNIYYENDIDILQDIFSQLTPTKEDTMFTEKNTSRLEADIIDRFYPDNKVQAIKYYRECTGEGLKEAKEFIDNLFENVK